MNKKEREAAFGLTIEEVAGLAGDYIRAGFDIDRLAAVKKAAQDEAAKRFEAEAAKHKDRRKSIMARLEAWAEPRKATEFKEPRHMSFARAVIGFFLHPHEVKLRSRVKEDDVVQALQRVSWGRLYLRQPPPVLDREAILRDRDVLTAEQLESVGLRIAQDDTFYIDPPKAAPAATSAQEAA